MINLETLLNQPVTSEIINLTAVIDTALCVGAGGSSGSLADKPIVRTAEGRLLIPASQLKGRLRHECEKLARSLGWQVCQSPKAETMCPQRAGLSEEDEAKFHRNDYQVAEGNRYHCIICQMFGNPALPSRLIFDDLICNEAPENLAEVIRPGVTLNRRRRTSEDQKFYYLETSPVNTQLEFEGKIHLLSGFPFYGKPLILSALKHINALGGSKSTGLGWLHWQFEPLSIDEQAWQFLLSNHKSLTG